MVGRGLGPYSWVCPRWRGPWPHKRTAMDERHQQIREGAGLEDSRLNTDFIDLMKRWGGHVLMVLAVVALGYWGLDRYRQAKVAKVNNAFYELEAIGDNPSPESLKSLADTYAGVRAVPELARLKAADGYMRAVRTGFKPGAVFNADGGVDDENDLVTPDDRAWYLDEAKRLFQLVAEATESVTGRELLAINGLYGLAAAAESLEQFDEAKGYYERLAVVAERASFPTHATVARNRTENMSDLSSVPELYPQDDLPPLPQPPVPEIVQAVTPEAGGGPDVLGPDLLPQPDETDGESGDGGGAADDSVSQSPAKDEPGEQADDDGSR